MDLTARVKTPEGDVTFSCTVHHSTSKTAQLIEPEFYEAKSLSGAVPEGNHHEMELLTPVWEHAHAAPIHWHRNPHTGRYFVCVTTALPTIAAAEETFKVWSLGTAYTMSSGKDFLTLIVGGDMMRFKQELLGLGFELMAN